MICGLLMFLVFFSNCNLVIGQMFPMHTEVDLKGFVKQISQQVISVSYAQGRIVQ